MARAPPGARQARPVCYLAYCNDHSDLRDAFCGGGACITATHAASCQAHWETSGRSESTRRQDPHACIRALGKPFVPYELHLFYNEEINLTTLNASYYHHSPRKQGGEPSINGSNGTDPWQVM